MFRIQNQSRPEEIWIRDWCFSEDMRGRRVADVSVSVAVFH